MAYKDVWRKAHCCILCYILIIPPIQAAANFQIIPTSPLPTQVTSGYPVTASYTVTNQTGTTLSNYTLQGLPASVQQITTGSNACSTPVTLSAFSSCYLQLTINDETFSNFALCKGSNCASAAVPLQVKRSSLPFILSGFYQTNSNTYPLAAPLRTMV